MNSGEDIYRARAREKYPLRDGDIVIGYPTAIREREGIVRWANWKVVEAVKAIPLPAQMVWSKLIPMLPVEYTVIIFEEIAENDWKRSNTFSKT